jgi:hypothetical protein
VDIGERSATNLVIRGKLPLDFPLGARIVKPKTAPFSNDFTGAIKRGKIRVSPGNAIPDTPKKKDVRGKNTQDEDSADRLVG